MRLDLLRNIAEAKDVTNVIVLTHNIDFVFVQTVVLSALRQCGHPSLTIFADASCAATSFSYQAPVLHGLGVRYRVVPVEMQPGFRFHPKAVLLSGPASATLYVGSGNLTFGGWRENAEIWVRFDSRVDGTEPFAAFLRYLHSIVQLVALPGGAQLEIEEAFDAKTHAWAANLGEPGALIGKPGDGSSLLDKMLTHPGVGAPERVVICSPYYDDQAKALSAIARHTPGANLLVLVQPGRTGLTDVAWGGVESHAKLVPITFQRVDHLGKIHEAFLHAKFYAFERAGRVTVFAGSANCSRAALAIPGKAGNAELMAVREMNSDEFRISFIEELVAKDGPPELASKSPQESVLPAISGLRLLGASFEGGYMRVAYAPHGWRVTACRISDLPIAFEQVGPGIIGVRVDRAPTRVVLEGTDDRTVSCASSWVDHEWELRSTARGRSLADTIRTRVRAGEWGVGAWSEVLEVFCAHLRYSPPSFRMENRGKSPSDNNDRSVLEYTAKDVFAAGYGLPSLSAYALPGAGGPETRVRSLQQLLLRWFGLPIPEVEDHTDVSQAPEPENDNDEVVDRPERLPTASPIFRRSQTTKSPFVNS